MKLLHLSDLHLGKRVHEASMLEDQRYILEEILKIADSECPQAVMIAGDIYDKSVPPAEAVQLFDDFLWGLSKRKLRVFVISGNHDSPERIAFGGRLMDSAGIYMSPVYGGTLTPVRLEDEFGPVDVYMLPFVKPAHVRRFFPEETVDSYTDALRVALSAVNWQENVRTVLVTHQFVTGASRSDSEEISVGGTDNVDAAVFDGFDYVALGHIHGPQNVGSPRIRYCGTPLKYSFSEAEHEKSVTVAELGKKGDLSVRCIPLVPKRDLRQLRGTYMELTAKAFYENTAKDDYIRITLTDEEDIPDAMARLRVIYENLLTLDYDNQRTAAAGMLSQPEGVEELAPGELFAQFYAQQNNQPMSPEQSDYIRELVESIWEERV